MSFFFSIANVFLGGGVGACFRFLINVFIEKQPGSHLLGTLPGNDLGCFFIGFLSHQYLLRNDLFLKTFLIIGLLGGLTTFSSFSFHCVSLISSGSYKEAFFNIVANNVLGIGFAGLGFWVAKNFLN